VTQDVRLSRSFLDSNGVSETHANGNLQIINMLKNHHLSKSIMDASWEAFLQILEDDLDKQYTW